MKIETKYSLGDKVFYMSDNRIVTGIVGLVSVSSTIGKNDKPSCFTHYQIKNDSSSGIVGYTDDELFVSVLDIPVYEVNPQYEGGSCHREKYTTYKKEEEDPNYHKDEYGNFLHE